MLLRLWRYLSPGWQTSTGSARRRPTAAPRPTRRPDVKNPRLLAAVAALPATATALSACGSADASGPAGVVSLRYQGWTDQVTLPEVAQDLGFFAGKVKLDWVGNTISGP